MIKASAKAVSPLIATVIIVSLTITASMMVVSSFTSLTKERTATVTSAAKCGEAFLSIVYVQCKKEGLQLKENETELVLKFKFDEFMGNVTNTSADSSIYGNNGTLLGTFDPAICCAVEDGGKKGNAIDFNGANYVEVPHNSSLNMTGKNFTIIAWIRPRPVDLTGYWKTVAEKVNDQWGLFVSSGVVTGYTSSTGGVYAITPLTAGTWYCAAFTRKGNYYYVYLNGSLEGTAVATGDLSAGNSLFLGGNSGDNWYTGDLDELAIYNRSLSEEEIKTYCDITQYQSVLYVTLSNPSLVELTNFSMAAEFEDKTIFTNKTLGGSVSSNSILTLSSAVPFGNIKKLRVSAGNCPTFIEAVDISC